MMMTFDAFFDGGRGEQRKRVQREKADDVGTCPHQSESSATRLIWMQAKPESYLMNHPFESLRDFQSHTNVAQTRNEGNENV